ncbi:hypothetical protein JOD52_002230 [Brachybacterium muris]|uniref:hypothetical protein n=1 Tax=Brachybacterium muris TaxID=219301 RepID=UPI001959137D|nr:hypothetical protein [Brachybacterium muris]MBM7501390.1 hypothetical protein [Brachybacterium muris]
MPAGASGPHRGGYWPPSARSAVPKSKIRWLPRLRILSIELPAHVLVEHAGQQHLDGHPALWPELPVQEDVGESSRPQQLLELVAGKLRRL